MDSRLKKCLDLSIEKNASDLHISPESPPAYRIDGELNLIPNMPILSGVDTKAIVYSLFTEHQRQNFESKLELDFNILPTEKNAGFRVNAFHQADGVAAVFRVIPREIPTLETLGTPAILKKIINLSSGLVLIGGPTGSGKSTTLAAMIEVVNQSKAKHIITIEDPIEFKHIRIMSLISQRQVPRDSLSFKKALRSALREDPDIILVGEMRDLESIRLALTAAETGRLVLGTLHTSSAPRAISRIVDVFPVGEKNIIKNMLSHSLQAVVCQILLKRAGGGRVAAFEVMLATPAIRNLIREDKIAQMYSVLQTSKESGMTTMEKSIEELIEKKIIREEDALMSNFQREFFEKL